MKKVIKYKNREEWLKNRSMGIGASEAGTVLGLNPWETPYQLWRRKKGIDPPKVENFAMKAGHYLEDAVSKFFEDEKHCHIIKASTDDFTIMNPEIPILRVSPDRTFWRAGARHNDKEKSILECKTTQMSIDPDNLPKHWFCQIQMNLGVAEYRDGALAWLTMGREFGCVDIDFDREFYDWMVGEITSFWDRYIVGGEEPPAYNAEDVLLKNPLHVKGKEVVATEEILEQLSELTTIKGDMGKLDERKKKIENDLKMFFGDAECIVNEAGTVLATWKAPKASKKFNEAKFAEDDPDLHGSYLEDYQGARRLLVKTAKG